jgi:hypothetical protein
VPANNQHLPVRWQVTAPGHGETASDQRSALMARAEHARRDNALSTQKIEKLSTVEKLSNRAGALQASALTALHGRVRASYEFCAAGDRVIEPAPSLHS